MSKKALLIICDGWGIGDKGKDDVIFNTPTPYWDELLKTYPASQLQASGENVGLPDGQMGNSEVGHLNIGAGRIVYQDLVKINIACRENTIMENPEIKRAYSYAKENNKQIHFMGLVSDGGVHSSLEHLLKLTDIAPMVPERFKALGHQGWTAMPISGSPQWYTLVTSLILGVGIGCLAQPQLVVRFMMVESTKQLNRGVLIGCVFLIVTVGAIYHVGALSNLFFLKTEGVVASEAVKDMDKIIPLFINKAMPEWFGAVFMLCILSASMSTLSAQFHTMGAAFGADAFPKLGRSKNPNSTLGVRIGVLCSILVSYVICYTLSASIIARGTALFMGICAATFLPTYFCSLYWKGATRQGALASLWVGGLASLFAMLFLHKAEAAPVGLCKALFGQDVLIDVYPWHAIDPILFALPLSAITIVLVSLATQKKTF